MNGNRYSINSELGIEQRTTLEMYIWFFAPLPCFSQRNDECESSSQTLQSAKPLIE